MRILLGTIFVLMQYIVSFGKYGSIDIMEHCFIQYLYLVKFSECRTVIDYKKRDSKILKQYCQNLCFAIPYDRFVRTCQNT